MAAPVRLGGASVALFDCVVWRSSVGDEERVGGAEMDGLTNRVFSSHPCASNLPTACVGPTTTAATAIVLSRYPVSLVSDACCVPMPMSLCVHVSVY